MVAFQFKPFTPELQAHECTVCLIYLCLDSSRIGLGWKSDIYIGVCSRKFETFSKGVCKSAGSTASKLAIEAICKCECAVKFFAAESIYLNPVEGCRTLESETYKAAEVVKSDFKFTLVLFYCTISGISSTVIGVSNIVLSLWQSDNISLCGTGIKHLVRCCQVTFNTESYRCLVVIFFCHCIRKNTVY